MNRNFHRTLYIEEWVNDNKATRIAEVGTSGGTTSRYILSHCPSLRFYLLIDWDGRDFPFTELVTKYHPHANFVKLFSHEAVRIVDDESMDLVFIDANHSYKSTKEDIEMWAPKVRKGGVICGHDYENPQWAGVKKAVDEIYPNATILKEEDEILQSVGAGKVWWVQK